MSTGARRSWFCLLSREYARGPSCRCGHRHGQPFQPTRKRRRPAGSDSAPSIERPKQEPAPSYGVSLFDA